MYEIKTDYFQGPLSLLLELIEKEKLDITKVSLGYVTEKYLEHIEELGDNFDTSELADFLVIAAKLLLIKSSALLPNFFGEDDSATDLENQLKIYKVYRDAGKNIKFILDQKRFSFSRLPTRRDLLVTFNPPKNISVYFLNKTMKGILKDLEDSISKIPNEKIKATVTIGERISELKRLMKASARIGFYDFLRSAGSKSEIVVSFLALLELIKQKELVAIQGDDYKIFIERGK